MKLEKKKKKINIVLAMVAHNTPNHCSQAIRLITNHVPIGEY